MEPLDQTDAIVIANSDLKPSTKKINHISKVITELKKIEIERTQEFNEVSDILDGIGDLLFVMDKNRIITRVNKSTCQVLKKKPEEIVGKPCYEVVHGSNEPWPNCPACKTFETKLCFTAEINDSNLGIPLLVTTSPILDEKGELIQCVHIAKDMTSIKLAEEELHIAANLFDAATDSILVHDLNAKFVYFNEMSYKSRGYTREEFQSLSIRDLQAPGMINDVGSKIQSMTDKEDLTFEALNICKNKTVFPVEVHLRVLESDGQKFVLSVARNISERRKAEEMMKQEEEKHRILLNSANVLIQSVNALGKFVFVNDEWKKVLGYSDPEVKGISITNIIKKDQLEHCMSIFGQVMKGESIHDIETVFVAKNGKEIAVSGNACPIFKDGQFVSTVAFFIDVSERKKADVERSRLFHEMNKRVKELNCIYRVSKIFEKSDIVMEDALLETVNLFLPAMQYPEVACARIVVGNQEFSTKNFEEAHWKLTADIKVRGEEVGFIEVCYLNERPIVDDGPFLKEERNLIYVIAERLGKIIERKEAEEALRASEQRWATTLCSVGDGVISTDILGKITFMNGVAENLTGWSLEDALEKYFRDVFRIFNEHSRLEVEDPVAKVLKTGLTVELANHTTLLQKDGVEIPIDDSAAPIKDPNGSVTGVVIVFRDRTERNKAEEKLIRSERKYREFADSLPEIVFEADDRGRFTFLNRKAPEIMGYSMDEMKQATFLKFLVPEDRQKAILNLQKKMQGEELSGNEYMLLRKDGGVFPAIIFSEKVVREDGKIGLRGVFVDISQTKKAAQELAAMNEKLRVVGGLTRHDVRNKLAAITGYAYLLKKKYSNLADVIDRVNRIELAVKESVAIFDFAKMYEQLGVEELVYVDVERVVDEAVGMFSGLTFEVSNRCRGLKVLADSFLRQMFYNFIDNTRKYGQKTIAIRVYYEKAASGELSLFYEDDGVGISAEDKLRLFSEGFSTGGSTGFGLFLSKKMIDVYGWKIQEIGEPGKGAKFVISIPATSSNGKENYQIIQ